MDVTKTECNTLDLNKERFNLVNLLFDIIKEIQNYTFNNKLISFEYDFNNSESVFVYADKNRISQVVSNLIGNSINFIQNDGVFSIGIDKIQKAKNDCNGSKIAVVEIKDTGIGIEDNCKVVYKINNKILSGHGIGTVHIKEHS